MDDIASSTAYEYLMQTPSPKSKRTSWGSQSPPTFSDRLIPSRTATNLACGFDLLEVSENVKPSNTASAGSGTSITGTENGAVDLYDYVLQSELLGKSSPLRREDDTSSVLSPERNSLFQYKSALEEVPLWPDNSDLARSPVPLRITEHPSQLRMPCRKIARVPTRIMDAPEMADDFYFNLLDWSVADDLAVGLGTSVYTWNNGSNRVTRVCALDCASVTSVNWAHSGKHLAVGTSSGDVQIWDSAKSRKLRTMTGHKGNVCSIVWNGFVLSTGGQDGCLIHRDVRESSHFFARVRAHKQQVCGLKWSHDEQQLASGSDDCKVRIWNLRSHSLPVLESEKHNAAVKALAWSPHQAGMLATGGGVADKCIHMWNTVNDVTVKSVNTGSQVCNLIWSKNVNEIVSTHGYSQFEVAIWKCPSLTRIASLAGHSRRVLYLALSPDGRKIATGSGDCSLRVWDVFPGAKACAKSPRAALLPSTIR